MDSKGLIKNIMDSPTYKTAETDDEFMEPYETRALNFEFLLQEGTISSDDLKIFKIAENAKEAWEYIYGWYK